ncbi:hypothetical protein [Stutzerimonas stutzeri]|uniref:hypothetical protein n=1 Tax=Stutzerimonas stutzeri TaxID=316 RepID=UPI0015E384E4|nr:hypothetical protein [Stutzerimonas stutzeri]MBA1224028.1 hypothetical protein [Stutzerimonas stutzeri]
MRNFYILLITTLLSTSTAFAQEDKLAIIVTMQYCQEAQIFYQRCMPQDPTTHKIFEDNLAKITARALQVVKETNPNMSDAAISETYWARREMLEKNASRGIEKRGCDGAQSSPKQYKACVEWEP